jgi:hypothetical protein
MHANTINPPALDIQKRFYCKSRRKINENCAHFYFVDMFQQAPRAFEISGNDRLDFLEKEFRISIISPELQRPWQLHNHIHNEHSCNSLSRVQ